MSNNKEDNKKSEKIDGYVTASFAEDFAYRFVNQYNRILAQIQSNGNTYLNPIWANTSMKKFNSYTVKPTEENVTRWLNNPREHEKELRECSYFLFDAIQHYNRSLSYLANILSFNYELIPLNPPSLTDDLKIIKLYQKQRQRTNDWLRYFRIKEQCMNIMTDVVRSGGACYYVRDNNENDGIYLQKMPEDYTVVNGRTDVLGYTYSMNMSFFYQFPEAMEGFAPEFTDYYKLFLSKKEILNEKANPWRLMPYEKGIVFKWDDSRTDMIPPLSGTMRDAISIDNYKEIMRLNMELQNYTLLYLQAPTDKDGKPTVDAPQIANYIALTQSLVNPTTSVISTPMKMDHVDFKNASEKDDIVGTGEQQYWSSAGIAGGIFGSNNSSSVGLKYSIQSDYEYTRHMYDQFERFINYKLSKIDGKFNFKIKFLRYCPFFQDDERKNTLSACQSGLPPERLFATYGYEPYEVEGVLKNSIINETRDMMMPLLSSFTQSNDKGRQEKSSSEIDDAGVVTRDGEYNENK